MAENEGLRAAIINELSTVIDPETGADVVRMRLIEELTVSEEGKVKYKFRPSSPICPIAIPLSVMIREAIASVPGVIAQDIEIVGYIQADELNTILREMLESMGHPKKSAG